MLPDPGFSSFPLPARTFRRIAAGHLDAEVVALLHAAERSRRLLLLQHLITQCRQHPDLLGPLDGVAAALDLLVAAERSNPATFEALLLDPHTGMWLAHALRLLSLPEPQDSASMLWTRLGALSTLAVSAALQARIPFSIRVPLQDGQLYLPGAGRLDLGPAKGPAVALASSEAGELTVEGLGRQITLHPSALESPPVVRASAGAGPVLQVRIDHLDPLPARVGLPPPIPLDPEAVENWRTSLQQAWTLLGSDHPAETAPLSAGLKSLLPLSSQGSGPTAGSSADAFGAAAMALLPDTTDLACALVHEFRHSVLNGLMRLVPLYRPEPGRPGFYAPWRDDPRPLPGMLHGAYAFSAVTSFWEARRAIDQGDAARRAELEFSLARLNTMTVLDQLEGSDQLTGHGREFLAELRLNATGWSAAAVSAEADRLARIVAMTHRATWRAHHVRVDADWVRSTARAWLDRAEPPRTTPAERISRDPQAHGLSSVFVLARFSFCGFSGPLPASWGIAAERDFSGGDRLLVTADSEAAAQRYLSAIAEGPDDARPWGGLALSSPVLRMNPERVRAVYREVRALSPTPPDVIELAGWLSPQPPGTA
nr:HEXXH motif domain-containing protein [Kineosporia babensis]